MAKKILVLDGHPAKDSFCGAIADRYLTEASKNGHLVRLVRLADLSFDTDFGVSSFRDAKPWETDLEAFWENLKWCEHFVIAHPLWWGGMPAKLKGLFDRVFLPGKAFQYKKGQALPEKLLSGRTSEVLLTADTPSWYFRLIYGSGVKKQTQKQILDFCGLKMKAYSLFGPIAGSTEESRAKLLTKAAKRGAAI